MDVPLVLDAIPRVCEPSRKDEIAEELLTHATEIGNLALVMMDREFDSDQVTGISLGDIGVLILSVRNPFISFLCESTAVIGFYDGVEREQSVRDARQNSL